jgi:hypothetical protein
MMTTTSPVPSAAVPTPSAKPKKIHRTRSDSIVTKINPRHRKILDDMIATTRLTLCATMELAIEALHEKHKREQRILANANNE